MNCQKSIAGGLARGSVYRVTDDATSASRESFAGRAATVLGFAEFGRLDALPPVSSADREVAVVVDGELPVTPLAFLARAYDLLPADGLLVILPPLSAAEDAVGARHRFLAALANHFGFVVVNPNGNSAVAWPLILRRTGRALRWRLSSPDPVTVPDWPDLFARAFGTPISVDLWQWKYGHGRGRCIAARREDRLIGYYGGTSRRIAWRGRPALALQVCDVMVDPSERAVMTKTGVFFLIASSFLELLFGYGQEFALAYGFPTRRHMVLAERLGLYAEVEKVHEITWTPLSSSSAWTLSRRRTTVDETFDQAAGLLWERMRQDLAEDIVIVRDPDYLRYRYLRHPERRYDVLTVTNRLTGKPRGIAILRRDLDDCKLMDIVAPLVEIPTLVDQARRQVAEWGLPKLSAWITSRHAKHFTRDGGEEKPCDVFIPTNVWTPGPSVSEVRDRWWLMLGDTEFS